MPGTNHRARTGAFSVHGIWAALSIVAAAGWGSIVSPTSAQVRTGDALGTRSSLVEGQLDVGASTGTVVPDCFVGLTAPTCPDVPNQRPLGSLALDFTGRVAAVGAPADHLFLEVDADLRFGLKYDYSTDGTYRGAWLGSPWIGAAIAHRTETLTVRGGLGVGIPLRSYVNQTMPEGIVAGPWGGWDQWLTLHAVVPMGLSGLIEARLGQLDVGAELAFVGAPRFSPFGGHNPGHWIWAGLGGWLSAHLGAIVRLGMRLQGLFWAQSPRAECAWLHCAPGSTGTDFQAAVVPFLRVLFSPGYAELRLQINLDEPYGPTLSGQYQVWSIAIRGGASWD